MARVVQRHGKPPILLIVFIILFVIAAIVAVVGFIQRDDLQTQFDENSQRLTDMGQQVEKLKQTQTKLVRDVTGLSVAPEVAMKKTLDLINSDTYQKAGGLQSGLVPEADLLAKRVLDKEKALASSNELIASLKKQLASKDEDIKKLQDDSKASLDKLEDEFTKLNKMYESDHSGFTEKAEQFSKDLTDTRKTLRDDAQKYEQKIEKLTLGNHGLKREIAKLKSQIDLILSDRGDKNGPSRKADGIINRVVPSTGLCYVNLGSEDNVQEGMTFAVYGPQDDSSAKSKAKLRAVTVSPTFSECKIIETAEGKVVNEQDVVTNLAYDPNRKYIFVVKGIFDLYSDGRASQEQTDEVVQAIKLHGGDVAKDVTVQTDYVVMGVEPTKPIKPAQDAPDSVQLAYKKQMEAYNEYFKTKKAAEALKIPVLNTNRFLELTGYMPEKRPQE